MYNIIYQPLKLTIMKRFSQKQLESIKSNFVCYQDSFFYVSQDKSCIDVYVGQLYFYLHITDDYIYLSIYKSDHFHDNSKRIFKQMFNTFSVMMLSLQGFQLSNL